MVLRSALAALVISIFQDFHGLDDFTLSNGLTEGSPLLRAEIRNGRGWVSIAWNPLLFPSHTAAGASLVMAVRPALATVDTRVSPRRRVLTRELTRLLNREPLYSLSNCAATEMHVPSQ